MPLWTKALIGLAAVVLVGGMVAGMLALDRREDRERPMYHDVLLVAGLQHDLLKGGRPGVELSVDDGSDPVPVGTEMFTPLPGVEIVVERRNDSYCVQGRNQYGDETRWICVDGTGDRPDVGVLEKEF